MRTIVLTAAALVIASVSAVAQTSRSAALQKRAPGGYERLDRTQPVPAWTAPADNARPSFAAHVSANGQGTN